jgi:hypothetical protein
MSLCALAWFYFWAFLHPGQGLPFPGPGMPAFTGTPVSYEASAHMHLSTAGTSASFSITLGGTSSTRAVLVGLTFYQNSASGITVTVGGNSAPLISGTDTGTTYTHPRSMLYGLATSLTGAQTVAISWTTTEYGDFGAISATGVNQSTPFNNGTFTGSNSSASSANLTITSRDGDLTSTVLCAAPGTLTPSSNQTEKWSDSEGSGTMGAGDVGPGTGTTTHTWTASFTGYALSGANFCHN